MELTETIKSINNQLRNHFGIDTVSTNPMWRVVWSEDQFENRLMKVTNEGFYLNSPEVRLVPKYRQWIREKYVLERLTLVPEINKEELAGQKISYEPIWVFEDKYGNYLPPKYEACEFVIDTIHTHQGKKSTQYVDPDKDKSTEEQIQDKRARVDGLITELFGDETVIGDKVRIGEGVFVPPNYSKKVEIN